MANLERVLIKFTRNAMPYAVGEVAGFARDRAALYVKHNAAHYCDQQGSPAKAPVTVHVAPPSVKLLGQAVAALAIEKTKALKDLAALLEQKAISQTEYQDLKSKLLDS